MREEVVHDPAEAAKGTPKVQQSGGHVAQVEAAERREAMSPRTHSEEKPSRQGRVASQKRRLI